MVFSSLFFIFAFLPVCMLIYWAARNIKAKNTVLLVFSLIFYTWGEPVYVGLLVFMTLCDWLLALALEKSDGKDTRRKILIVLTCVINLGLIGVFKYTGFFCENLQNIFGFPETIPQIILPIGISFYTFQLLSYVIDVYKKEVPAQKNFFWLLLYSSLFYQCIAGPIVRYADVEKEIHNRKTSINEITEGITRFTVGLAKKALIANTCGSLSDTLLVSDAFIASSAQTALTELSTRSVAGLWLGVLFYMLQIYLDFSAYSDMAIGMGLMVGFHFKENFNYPYTAKSVTDFWRRWHISLSSFFRDYVYIPLGGNRKGTLKTYRNILVVWLLTGLWHGASWNFVLWGLFFCVFLVIEKLVLLKILKKIPSVFSHAYLLIIVFFGWILFRFSDFSFIPVVVKGLFGLNGNPLVDFETKTFFNANVFFIIVAVLSVFPFVKKLSEKLKPQKAHTPYSYAYGIISAIVPVALLILSTLSLVGDSYNPFLYFQF